MSDWVMVVESFPGGKHNWPRVSGPPRPPRTGPRLVVTTLKYVRASSGRFIFEDHAARWRVDAPNLEVTAGKLGMSTGDGFRRLTKDSADAVRERLRRYLAEQAKAARK